MPKTFSPELFSSSTRKKMNKAIKEGINSSNVLAQILKDDNEYVGEGGRVVVAATEKNPEILVAISFKEVPAEQAKNVYYNHKILSLLFPYNFPKILASFGRSEGKGVSVNFRERVRGRNFTKAEAQVMKNGNAVSSKEHPFANVIGVCESLGIGMYFDGNNRNYMLNDFGDEVYVDTISYSDWDESKKNVLLSYMRKQGYDGGNIRKAEAYINRLIVINGSKE